MRLPLTPTAVVFSFITATSFIIPGRNSESPGKLSQQKIQVAILLDVSGSMQGLIEQAKGQLWNMVKVLGNVQCDGSVPSIEIALYEYGRESNDPAKGYIKQLSPFTADLDNLSTQLYSLSTNGGEEYCGQVIHTALAELNWDNNSSSYKVIFIAGNEDFLQGTVSYTLACENARKKGVIVNTIYCGSREQGIAEHWDLGGECGKGSFSIIDHNAKDKPIITPYDSTILLLKGKLNETYLAYGTGGQQAHKSFEHSDTSPVYSLADPTKIAQYVIVKSNPRFSGGYDWDLTNAAEKNINVIDTLDMKTLADSLQHKTRDELRVIVKAKIAERGSIQTQIKDLDKKRDAYLKAEKEKMNESQPKTLETEIEKTIREQVKRYNMIIQ